MPLHGQLGKHERAIWHTFLAQHPWPLTNVRYNCYLGKGHGPRDGTQPRWRKVAVRLSRKRADVIANLGDTTIIFEIKHWGDATALGQLLTYRQLYLEEYEPVKPLRLVVVCKYVEPELKAVYAAYDIEWAETEPLWVQQNYYYKHQEASPPPHQAQSRLPSLGEV